MPSTEFLLSVKEHRKNICSGINSLQQNNEFVDMTLAADGHLVKVHQFLMALSSPYLKQLIKSAQCPHPVIFLNKVSYDSLCGILQYIYTGEVLVTPENIKHLLEAAKSLHIIGLESMEIKDDEIMTVTKYSSQQKVQTPLDVTCELQVSDSTTDKKLNKHLGDPISHHLSDNNFLADTDAIPKTSIKDETYKQKVISMQEIKDAKPISVYYTVSNRGAIQIICNRYIYFPGYSYKNKRLRRWRCVENIEKRCPAVIVTKDDMVVQRCKAHNHPFHDKRILKKTHQGRIFTTLCEAEENIKSNNAKNQKT